MTTKKKFKTTREEAAAVKRIREAFTRLNSEDRLGLLELITEGYCTLCGDEVDGQCYCAPAFDR